MRNYVIYLQPVLLIIMVRVWALRNELNKLLLAIYGEIITFSIVYVP